MTCYSSLSNRLPVRLLFLTLLFLFLAGTCVRAQEKEPRYELPRRTLPLEKALIKLTEAGAELSYRPDQIPQLALRVPGGRRTLPQWLNFLLRDTDLIHKRGPAGYLIVPDPLLTERTFTVHGVITDAESGERLIGAAIQQVGTDRGTLTNEYGFYSLDANGGRQLLRVSYTGYQARDFALVLRGDTTLDVALALDGLLPQIEVRANSLARSDLFLTESETSIRQSEVSRVNGIGGEADILNVARLLPGITSGANGFGGLSIRGSSSGHNLILLDGVPVYNVNHAGGLFSIFNDEAVRRADVYKDGIPAHFGGRIGGVLDVHTRDGNLYQPQITLGSSLLAGTVTAEGPVRKGKSSFLASGRYFWGGQVLSRLSANNKRGLGRDGQIDYDVYDLNFKLNQQVGKNGRLYLSLYRGTDDFANTAREENEVTVLTEAGAVLKYEATQRRGEAARWGNTVGALRYNYVFSDRFFANFRLSYSDLFVRAEFVRSDSLWEANNERLTHATRSGRFGSEIRQWGTAFDGQVNLAQALKLRFGLTADLYRFLPQIRTSGVPLERQPALPQMAPGFGSEAAQLVAYASLEGAVGWLRYRAGLRQQYWRSGLTAYRNLSPRLVLGGSIRKRNHWRLTYDRQVQPIHLISSTIIGLPSDLWVPAGAGLRPSVSRQYGVQYNRQLGRGWELQIAGYDRGMRDLVDYVGTVTSPDLTDDLSVGTGVARGVETTVSYARNRTRGWLSYTLAQSRRRFDERINFGQEYPFQFDRRHAVKLLASYDLRPHLNLTATWRLESGSYFSFGQQAFVIAAPGDEADEGAVVNVVENKNGLSLPPNHRLDVNAQWQLSKDSRRRFQHVLNFGVYNLYSRHNPVFYDLRSRYFSRGFDLVKERNFVQIFFGGALPTLSYRMTFRGGRSPIESL